MKYTNDIVTSLGLHREM